MEYGTWFELSDPKWEGAQCDSECGYLIRDGFYDEAHSDTTATGDITTYFLGVEPTAPGYRRFRFSPRFISRLTFAEGSVPTPHGFIRARWYVAGDKATCRLSVPAGTEADVVLPGVSKTLGPGEHVVEAVGIKASRVDPTITSVSYGGMKAVEVENYVSHIYGNRDAVFEYIADLGDVRDVRGVEIEAGDLKLVGKPSASHVEDRHANGGRRVAGALRALCVHRGAAQLAEIIKDALSRKPQAPARHLRRMRGGGHV